MSEKIAIIMIDDVSSVPARFELTDIVHDHPGRIVTIEQPNADPIAARNKGLDNVLPGTEYVAFLNSDDEWSEAHLVNSVTELRLGYDFYRIDHFQLSQIVSVFNHAKRIDVAQHSKITEAAHLREYAGDMFDQILMANIIGTPTVVYRFAMYPSLLF